ncbi:MAG TPA: hypothetical protein DEA43_03750 [Candidatus Moranbacteria bacterium]|nr:hypothetical protein [Candidatus Moranbacteria bacterium]HBT45970.1 hypothetical protein [Candidatus Moranbacteria bacterium]
MYIKVKHIKQFLLFSACLFFAGFNYLTYVKADTDSTTTVCDKTTDSDCDGLTNAEETLYKTDPNNIDTDGDSYSDGVEVESGYDPTIAAPADRLATVTTAAETQDTTTQNTTGTSDSALTDDLAEDLKTFVESKGDEPITNSEINDFVTENLSAVQGEPITLATLPVVDISKIKTIDQTYATLSAEEKKKKIKADAEKYITQVGYLVISSSPKPILSQEDFTATMDEFMAKFNSFAESNTDQAYFLDIANRTELLLPQLLNMEVPQTFVNQHVKIIRIAMGFLSLREMLPTVDTDPVLKMAMIKKIQELTPLLADFFQTDFLNYTKQFEE